MTAEEARDDKDLITGTFLVNKCYASVLFDTCADRSYMSTKFCALFDKKPQTLDTKCLVEIANGKFVKVDRIYKECNLTLANKTFNVDLMPVELGSFDVVLGMDWLSPMKVSIQCFDKTINIPLKTGEILVIQGDKSASKLNLISCIKTQKYLMKGCQAILAHIKEVKPDERRIKDVPVVKDFPEVFPDELPGLSLQIQVKFQIDLIPSAAPIAKMKMERNRVDKQLTLKECNNNTVNNRVTNLYDNLEYLYEKQKEKNEKIKKFMKEAEKKK
ncbi:uncharacterized protein [Rutidosis leptorrhynchoides]|uniref:uncharacterized protein n=1 Tax=Rutidosis leptorrhynchoides TaxID=125765 RepID=UPI003A996410